MEKLKRKSSYYIAYSAAMTGIFMIILFIFWKNGKSFVRDGDGLRQHYITLEYWGKYLRQIIKELLIHHRLRIPTWDLHIGFGSDIVTTLHYYVIGDPLNLCAAFVPVRYTEYLYASSDIIWQELHSHGIAFIIKTKKSRFYWEA